MPAAVSVPNTFVAATTAQSAQVNANFAALVTWINTNAVPLDGTKPMTGTLSGPAGVDPTTADQYARKAYVDATVKSPARSGVEVFFNTASSSGAVTTQASGTEISDSDNYYPGSGGTITIPAGQAGLYSIAVRTGVGGVNWTVDMTISGNLDTTGKGVGDTAGTSFSTTISRIVALVVGDTLTFKTLQSSGSPQFPNLDVIVRKLSL